MTRARTKVDKLVDPALKKVARKSGFFRKSEVVAEVLGNAKLASMLRDARNNYGDWGVDEIIRRHIENRTGELLQKRDAHGIRVYECYAAGEQERRWMPFRAMNADTLRAVARQARTQARQLTLKGEGYEHFIRELEKHGKDAKVEDVYDEVLPIILKHRGAA